MFSIIIPTLNRSRSLIRALRSLRGQDFPAHGFEALIVDNGSTDPTRSVAEGFIARHPGHRFRYIHEPEQGLLFVRNRGASEARGDILVFIDDDIEPALGWLKAIQRSFVDPSVQLVGGRILPRYEARPPAWLEWFWTGHPEGRFCAPLGLLDFGSKARAIDPQFIWGDNFSIRRKTLFDLGGFHPEYLPWEARRFEGDGEVGLTRKAKAAGCKAVYHPKALVRHRVPKERMTPEYFEKRFFFSGVGGSFTRLRESGGRLEDDGAKSRRKDRLKERFENIGAFDPSDRDPEKQALVERFNRAYREGFEFHQAAVRRSPALLRWVLRKDYLDCKLPRLSAGGFLPRLSP
ncbi:MAG: glycosyltransferase family 2 protein [Elusimicrobia bacterium]|nr:glycosyltransferase family 2 protein [Elusimicrobiota bacterium]